MKFPIYMRQIPKKKKKEERREEISLITLSMAHNRVEGFPWMA